MTDTIVRLGEWVYFLHNPPPADYQVLLFNPEWVHDDFNPSGTGIGHYFNAENHWVISLWNECLGEYTTHTDKVPEYWRYIK